MSISSSSIPAASLGAASTTETANKIAEVTFGFWLMKIIATTLGETTGDFIAQTLNLGYVVGLGITLLLLIAAAVFQIKSPVYKPGLFWAAIVATTTAGTEISDLMDRTLGLGYTGGSVILTLGLLITLAVWYKRDGDLSVDPIWRKDAEIMFWIAFIFTRPFGATFGDFLTKSHAKGGLDLGTYNASFVCAVLMIGIVYLGSRRMVASNA